MSQYTVANLQRITRENLADLLRSKPPGDVAIIDVRDSDYIGGHIRGCTNVPTQTLDYRLPELVRTLRDTDTVVFHCMLSQQRGPFSALRYLRERDRLLQKGEVGVRKDGTDLAEAQRVVLLEGGFGRWQEKYGDDEQLTEGYVKEIWQED